MGEGVFLPPLPASAGFSIRIPRRQHARLIATAGAAGSDCWPLALHPPLPSERLFFWPQIFGLRKTKMDKHTRAADLKPRTYDAATHTIEVIWTTGASVRRRDYMNDVIFDEVLSLAPGHVRLERLNAGAPLLDSHDDRRLASVLGSVVPGSAKIENGVGVARVKLSTADEDADVIGKIIDGIIRHLSVGYAIHSIQVSVGTGGAEETRTVVDWEPLEISAVPVPADAGSHFRSHQSGPGRRLRRATLEELHAMGRTSWLTPDEFWPLIEDTQ